MWAWLDQFSAVTLLNWSQTATSSQCQAKIGLSHDGKRREVQHQAPGGASQAGDIVEIGRVTKWAESHGQRGELRFRARRTGRSGTLTEFANKTGIADKRLPAHPDPSPPVARDLSREAESRTAAGRRARRRGWRVRAGCSVARHRRRGVGKDQHPRASGGASDRQPRRSAPYPADDLLPAGGGRDDPARRAHLLASPGVEAPT